MLTTIRMGPGIFTKVDLRRFPSKKTILLMRFCTTSNGIPSGPNFANERRTGNSVARGEWRMERGEGRGERGDAQSRSILSEWPILCPMRWRDDVNQVQSESEVDAIQASVKRGIPSGTDSWITQSAVRLHLEHTLRSRGRPRKNPPDTRMEHK